MLNLGHEKWGRQTDAFGLTKSNEPMHFDSGMNERGTNIKEQDKTDKQARRNTHRFTTYQSNENQL